MNPSATRLTTASAASRISRPLRKARYGSWPAHSPAEAAREGVRRGAGVAVQPGDDLGRRELVGQLVRLAGPQVDQVRVALAPRVRAQRRREVVDLRIGERRVGVLGLEAVDDP